MKKVGLVLEGGGLRGLYTAGVLDVLMDKKIKVDCIVGTSAGALFGVNYFSNQKGRVLRYNKEYCNDKRYMSMRSLLLTGNYVNKKFAYYRMSKELDQFDNLAFLNAKKDFYAVATNVYTGQAEYFKITNPFEQLEEFRASGAMPLLSRMVQINGEKYLDGGISDSIPIAKALSLGLDKIIVVETQTKEYRKTPLKPSKAKLFKIRFFKYPNLVRAILSRYKRYNAIKEDIANMEENGEVFVIRPSKKLDIKISNKNKEKYQEIYDLGVSDAKKSLKKLKKFLNSKNI